jgi:hypothetical protein
MLSKALKVAVIASLTFLAACSKSTVIERNGMRLTFTDQACKNEVVLELSKLVGVDKFKGFQGKVEPTSKESTGYTAELCFFVNPEDTKRVLIIDEKGGIGFFNIKEEDKKAHPNVEDGPSEGKLGI